jgi:hypothetical protein
VAAPASLTTGQRVFCLPQLASGLVNLKVTLCQGGNALLYDPTAFPVRLRGLSKLLVPLALLVHSSRDLGEPLVPSLFRFAPLALCLLASCEGLGSGSLHAV